MKQNLMTRAVESDWMAIKPPAKKRSRLTIFMVIALQLILGLAGLAGAVFHAFPTAIHEEHQNFPVLDVTTIAWLGLVVVAVVFPRITEVAFGDLSVKLQEATESSEGFRDVSNDLANLTQNWSTSALLLLTLLEAKDNANERNSVSRNFVRDRMGEARVFLGDSPDSTVRIAIWIYDENDDILRFEYSPHFTPTQKDYQPGEGFLGQAFLERRTFSEADVRQIPSYKRARDGDPPYRGVMCIPLKVGDEVIGMLTIDKPEATDFTQISEEIARGLSAQCAYALELRRRFAEFEDPIEG